MSDQDQAFLLSQTALLTDIRDELRATRGMAASGGSGGMSAGAARPGHTFVAAQAAADRTLLGAWNSFGWSQAYSAQYHSTLFGDLSALVGFNRAPQTLTQSEFQSIAGQNISARAGNFAVGMIAPEYVSRTNALADDIYRNSSRFVRFGNQSAGVLGTGLDFNVARSISRGIQTEALGDLRMSGQDYSTITSLGMQSGQFDQAGGVDEFKSRVRELASATGDLTRALHMTVSEVGTAMGNLRQMGVTGVAEQRSIMMKIGGSSMVAGMSAPEMMQFSGSIGQQGMALGLNASTTMPAAASTLALIRSMSQSGMLAPGVLAMGGGAANIAGQIVGAEMRYATSQGGYLSMLGGGGSAGANTYSSIIRGMGRAGAGTFEGMVTMNMDRFQNMRDLTPEQMEMNMRNMFETNMRMTGVKDMTSRTAQGMAFQMAHGLGMDDAAALAFSQANFTSAGRQASDVNRIQTARASASREQALSMDNLQLSTSWKGRFRAGLQALESNASRVVDGAMDSIDLMTGTSSYEAYQASLNSRLLGGGGDLSLAQLGRSFSDSAGNPLPQTSITTLHIRNRDNISAASATGTTATMAASALVSGNPMGWGAVAGMELGAIVSGVGSVGTTMWGSGNFTEVKDQLAVQSMLAANAALMHTGSSPALQKQIESGIFNGQTTSKIFGQFQNRGALDAAGLQAIAPMLAAGAAESNGGKGVKLQTYVDALSASGLGVRAADVAEESSTGASAAGLAAIKATLSGVSRVGSGIGSLEGIQAQSTYIDRVLAGNLSTDLKLEQQLGAALGSADAVSQYKKSVLSFAGGAGRDTLAAARAGLNANARAVSNSNINSLLSGGIGLAKSSVDLSGLSAEKKKRYGDMLSDPNADFLGMMKSGDFQADAARGAFGQHGILQEVAMIGSADLNRREGETAEMEARRLSKKFHISGLTAETVGSLSPDQLRNTLMASKLTSAQVGKERQASSPEEVAHILTETKDALVKLNRELDLKQNKTK